jgi:predicted metal-dependent peptidase
VEINMTSTLAVFQFWKDVASQLRTAVPFVSEALNVLPLIESKKVQFAGTDNKCIMVNPESWGAFQEYLQQNDSWFPTDQGAIAAVLLHECLHVILKHKQRSVGVERPQKWAAAVDITTNNMLVDIFSLPPFSYTADKMEQFKKALSAAGIFEERFRGKDTDQVYKTLCEEDPDEEEKDPGDPGDGGDGGSTGDGDDAGDNGESNNDGAGSSDPDANDGDSQGGDKSEQDSGGDQDSGSGDKPLDNELGDDFDSGVPDDVKELIDNSMQDYLERNAAYAPYGSALANEIKEARKKPPILMSHVLRKVRDVVSGTVFDYRKPSRQDAFAVLLGSEGRMPSYHTDPSDILRELVIALDFSGSMGVAELQAAFSLVRDAFKHVKRDIRLLCFTDHVVQDIIVTKNTELTSRFSGGTNISCLINYFENPTICTDPSKNGKRINPSAIVIVTDAIDPRSMPALERWKYKNRLRNIVIKTGIDMPGLTFHCDCVDGYPRG